MAATYFPTNGCDEGEHGVTADKIAYCSACQGGLLSVIVHKYRPCWLKNPPAGCKAGQPKPPDPCWLVVAGVWAGPIPQPKPSVPCRHDQINFFPTEDRWRCLACKEPVQPRDRFREHRRPMSAGMWMAL